MNRLSLSKRSSIILFVSLAVISTSAKVLLAGAGHNIDVCVDDGGVFELLPGEHRYAAFSGSLRGDRTGAGPEPGLHSVTALFVFLVLYLIANRRSAAVKESSLRLCTFAPLR